ncbi:HEAT repeat domain-containing protein [Sphingobacterium sp. HMA12]|uniref:HEAT repeat domain-containing protein n=1 Tax=Sphingobacterium sp. HMA12 TaxID=2050894 RepID=UPI0013151D16|nr:HEAT repeat domain-containing protein [Sphingobacterium sp. HMA12]
MRDNLKDFVNANRDAFDHKEPPADLWNKIKPQVVPQVKERKIKPLWRWASIAAATLLLGTATLLIFNQKEDRGIKVADVKPISVQKDVPETMKPAQQEVSVEVEKKESIHRVQTITARQKINRVARTGAQKASKDENLKTKKQDYMQMLQDSTWASTRLAAVLGLQKQGGLNEDATRALEKMAVSDESSNVRMAAIETLLDGMTPEARQQKVQDFFVAQNDPTLQVELMQMIGQRDELEMKNSTKEKLNAIVEDPFTLKFVKEQAYAVLLHQ